MESESVQFVANVTHKYQMTFPKITRGKLQRKGIDLQPGDLIELAFVRRIDGGGRVVIGLGEEANVANERQQTIGEPDIIWEPDGRLEATNIRLYESDLRLYRDHPELHHTLAPAVRKFVHGWLRSNGFNKIVNEDVDGGDRGRRNTAKEEEQHPGAEQQA